MSQEAHIQTCPFWERFSSQPIPFPFPHQLTLSTGGVFLLIVSDIECCLVGA